MSYFPSISQNVVVDTNNSCEAESIASGATWNSAGTGSSTLGVNAIQLAVTGDQNLTIYVDQGRTDSTFQITDTYEFNVLKGNFGITVQAVGAYVRVRVKNNGSASATVSVDTVLCPIVEAVPRSLDSHGHLKVAVYETEDDRSNKQRNTMFGELLVAEPYRMVGTPFTGAAFDTQFWTATSSGTAASTAVSGGIATLTSGTDNNGYANLASVRRARFIISHPNCFRALIRIPDVTETGNTRRWGVFTQTGTPPTSVDGFYFELSDAGVLSVNTRNAGGTVASVSSGSFNGEVSVYTVDTNAHVYEIEYLYKKIQFVIDGMLIHTVIPTTAMASSDFTLPIGITTVNSAGGTESAQIEVWAAAILRLGKEESAPKYTRISGAVTAQVLKSGAGRLHSIMYNGIPNASTLIVYDAITATNTMISLAPPNGAAPFELDPHVDFYTGLTVTTTQASTDITLIYE